MCWLKSRVKCTICLIYLISYSIHTIGAPKMSLGSLWCWSYCSGGDAIGVCGHWNGCLVASNHILFCDLRQDEIRIGAGFASKHLFQQSRLQFISITCLISLREGEREQSFVLKGTWMSMQWEQMSSHQRDPVWSFHGLFSVKVILPPLQNYTIVAFKNFKWLCNSLNPSHKSCHALSKHSQQALKQPAEQNTCLCFFPDSTLWDCF